MLFPSFDICFYTTCGYGITRLPTYSTKPTLPSSANWNTLAWLATFEKVTANSDNSRQLVGFHSRTQPHNQLVVLTVVARAEVFGRLRCFRPFQLRCFRPFQLLNMLNFSIIYFSVRFHVTYLSKPKADVTGRVNG